MQFNKYIQQNLSLPTLLLLLLISAFLGAATAILLIGTSAQASRTVSSDYTDHLAVQTLSIVDKNKEPRGHIFVDENGLIGLVFTDSTGMKRLSIQAGEDSSSFELFNHNGVNRFYAGVSRSSCNGIFIRGEDGSIISAATQKGSSTMVALTDQNNRVRHSMNFDDNKTAYIMTGPSGDEANMIFMEKDGTRGFSMSRRRSGGPIAVLGMNGDKPSLVMHDGDKSGLAVGYSASGEAGMLINQDGRPIWKAGAGSIRQTTPSIVDLIK